MTKRRSRRGRRLFVLDTNVLMHDPAAIFRFEEHDIYLPMVVLEELDAHKKGLSEASRNVRQVSRFLDELMRDASRDKIEAGLPLPEALLEVLPTDLLHCDEPRRCRRRCLPAVGEKAWTVEDQNS